MRGNSSLFSIAVHTRSAAAHALDDGFFFALKDSASPLEELTAGRFRITEQAMAAGRFWTTDKTVFAGRFRIMENADRPPPAGTHGGLKTVFLKPARTKVSLR
jgi:hypothetical protein